MATLKDNIFAEIRGCCVSDNSAWHAAGKVAKLVEEKFTYTNTGSPKLLDKMDQFAKECERAGNDGDARCVRSWVKQLRASA